MDPLSALTGLAGLLDVTTRSSVALHRLYKGFKYGPDVILALSNEFTDLSLNKAEDVLTRLDALSRKLSAQKQSGQRVRWIWYQSKAAALKDELREVRRRIHELLVAQNITITADIHLRLRNISLSVINGSEGVAETEGSGAVANENKDKVAESEVSEDALESPPSADSEAIQPVLEMAHRISTLEECLTATLVQRSILDRPRSKKSVTGLPATPSDAFCQTDAVYFTLGPVQRSCSSNTCRCQCHQPTQPDLSWDFANCHEANLGSSVRGIQWLPCWP
ncbi:hypothetical protein B0H66DRAFT_591446 [Apodospora peruviana]|uniref:Fungal N-terminal domain-containing protein n=1 Tax=Apodospora peruviana TaxID=516989 RepID=A0AAE0I5F9_9PEZI|nr:hypothetical protein B0H66DRAFT_591446 [Apodospora peruviana]